LISRIEEFRLTGLTLREAVRKGADVQMRPILMATLGAAIGLLPAALATGIGSQAQKPLALVVVGGMLTAAVLILVVLPVLYEIVHRRSATNGGEKGDDRAATTLLPVDDRHDGAAIGNGSDSVG
jgi:heavy metal efflux system protein